MSENQRIIQERPAHKYFTMIPNLYDDSEDTNLSVYEFRLLVHYARVGTCYEGLRITAKKCGMSKSQVSRARTELVEGGWIEVSDNDFGTVDVVVKDKWKANTRKYGGTREDRPPQGHPSLTGTEVSPTGTGVSLPGTKEDLIKKNKEEETSTAKKLFRQGQFSDG